MNTLSSLLMWIGNVIGANPNTLKSESKTIVGAINEEHDRIGLVSEDYITEVGSSGNWRYRKWNSGKVEAWGYQSYSSIAITTGSSPGFGGYRSDVVTMSIPSGIFSRTPDYVFVQKKTSQGGAIYFAGANSATNIQMIFGGCTTAQTITDQVVLAYVVLV